MIWKMWKIEKNRMELRRSKWQKEMGFKQENPNPLLCDWKLEWPKAAKNSSNRVELMKFWRIFPSMKPPILKGSKIPKNLTRISFGKQAECNRRPMKCENLREIECKHKKIHNFSSFCSFWLISLSALMAFDSFQT